MNLRRILFPWLGLNFDTCRVWFCATVCIFTSIIVQAGQDPDQDSGGLVEMHVAVPRPEVYREYRPRWALRFGFSYESFSPTQFTSPIDSSSYSTDFGGTGVIPLVTTNLGTQYTLKIGTFSLDAIYGKGNGSAINNLQTTLNLTKVGLGIGFMLDQIAQNPWVIPYATFQQVEFMWNHSVGTVTQSGTTAQTSVFTVGISLPLGLIDPEAGQISSREYGIKETYLDIFGIEYATSNSSTDPDFQTNMSLGAGLHFIF